MVTNVLDQLNLTNVHKLAFEYSSTELLYTELNNIKINSKYLYLIQFILIVLILE